MTAAANKPADKRFSLAIFPFSIVGSRQGFSFMNGDETGYAPFKGQGSSRYFKDTRGLRHRPGTA